MSSTTRIIVWTVAAAVALFLALAVTGALRNPASAVGPRLMDRNRIDHFEYSDTAKTRQVVNGTEGDDVIHGNKVGPGKPAQVINGLAGNDRIWGGKGSDEVNGGPGRDHLHGYHAGADELNGGPGKDVCVIARTPGGHTNDDWSSCLVKFKPSQGHG